MSTIWNAAAGLAAIPLVVPTEQNNQAITAVIETARVEHVDTATWEKPTEIGMTDELQFAFADEPKPLTLREEKRLHELAVNDALGKLTTDDREEFNNFQLRRVRTQQPLPVTAIEKRERVLRMMDNLLIELNALKREPRKVRT